MTRIRHDALPDMLEELAARVRNHLPEAFTLARTWDAVGYPAHGSGAATIHETVLECSVHECDLAECLTAGLGCTGRPVPSSGDKIGDRLDRKRTLGEQRLKTWLGRLGGDLIEGGRLLDEFRTKHIDDTRQPDTGDPGCMSHNAAGANYQPAETVRDGRPVCYWCRDQHRDIGQWPPTLVVKAHDRGDRTVVQRWRANTT